MFEKLASFRFIPAKCIYLNRPEICPVEEGSKFTARLDGKDKYRVHQSPGRCFATCPHCKSKKSIEEA
jgi:hypothetical protein